MAETYTSGVCKVKEGRDDEFVQAWTEFVSWGSGYAGSGTFRLVRDLEDASLYMSFAPWESFEAQQAWKQAEEFPTRIGRVREHVESFQPSTFEFVAELA